jgi:hypothetical protein
VVPNYTLRKVRALKITPDNHIPGDVYEVTQDVADILTSAEVGCVEYADEKPEPSSKIDPGRHQRRDLRARE